MNDNKIRNSLCALIFVAICVHCVFPQKPAASTVSYTALLADSASRVHADKHLDEVSEALSVINARGGPADAGEVVANLKRSFPAIDPKGQIGLLPAMRESLVTGGEDYDHLLRVVTPLLKFCSLENKVVPILYRSEQPVVALSYPNALIFSTRALSLFTDDEAQAMAAHEVVHLIGREVFKRAVDEHDNRTLRLIELFCDAGAASILQAMGKMPGALTAGLLKQEQVLELEYDGRDAKGDHPTMANRERLSRTLRKQFENAALPSPPSPPANKML